MDGGARQATVHRVTKSRTHLNDFHHTYPPADDHEAWHGQQAAAVS